MNKDTEKVEVRNLIKVSEIPSIREEVLRRAPGRLKLLLDPLYYAQGAVANLEEQLTKVKAPKRRAKLEYKIGYWKKCIEVLTEQANGNKEAEAVVESAATTES